MIRALHVAAGNLYGGVESLLVTLARTASADVEARFALTHEGRLADELRAAGARVHSLEGGLGPVRASRPWTVLAARGALRRVIEAEGIDVVIVHGCWPHALLGPAARVPLVHWAHDAVSGSHWAERWARRTRPAHVIANSAFTASRLEGLFAGVPSSVLHAPVAAPSIADRETTRRLLRRELGTNDDSVVILLTSRFERWKGHALLVEALARLRHRPEWTAWIVGGVQRPHEETYRRELEEAVATHGLRERVRFTGGRSDVAHVLAAADVHCQPNLEPEPFGIAFVEALLAGVPVVTTARGGALEIVDATCGLLVEPEPASVAAALERLIADRELARRLGGGGPARAKHLCDPEARVADLAAILARATGRARAEAAG